MDAATQARIFEPFFTTKEPGKGTGLGLSTVLRHRAPARRRASSVDSELGRGTTFKIYLPAVDEAASRSRVDRDRGPRRRAARRPILLVEDEDERARARARGAASASGYTVLEASDGARGPRVAASSTRAAIDLLLTDVVMPRMSGRELAERLRRDPART